MSNYALSFLNQSPRVDPPEKVLNLKLVLKSKQLDRAFANWGSAFMHLRAALVHMGAYFRHEAVGEKVRGVQR